MEVVRALYKYSEPHGLCFDIGEKIVVHEKGQDGWWKGVIILEDGEEDLARNGWFPATFVTLDNGHETSSQPEVNGNVEELGDWCTAYAEDGRVYYYNKVTQETSWDAPKSAAEFPLEDELEDFPAPPPSMMDPLVAVVPPMPSVSPPSPPRSRTQTSSTDELTAVEVASNASSPPADSPLASPCSRSRDRHSIISSSSAEELRAHALERATRKATLTSVKAPKKGSPSASASSSLHASNDSLTKMASDSPVPNRRRKSKASQLRSWYFTLPPAEKGSKQPLINSIQVSYCDHFWEDTTEGTGFEVVLSHIHKGKSMCREMAEFFRERALLEDLYSRNLARLSKSNLGDHERGTTGYAWRSLKKSLEDEARSRQQFAGRLLQELERPLLEYSEGTAERKKELKKLDAMVQDDRKAVASKYKEVEKARAALYERQKTVETMRTNGASMKGSDYAKAQKKAVIAADEMRRIVEAYNQSQSKWVEDMILALLELEKIESERIEFVKKRLDIYIQFQQNATSNCDKAALKLNENVTEIDPIKDRQEFIQMYGTGVVRPVDFTL